MRPLLMSLVMLGALSGFGCRKAKPRVAPTTASPTTPATSPPTGEPASGFGGVAGGLVGNPNAAGGGGGGGTIQAVRGAAKRAATQNDLQQLRLVIEDLFNTNGRMPSAQETYAALQRGAPNVAGLVNDQTLTLNNPRGREDVWAYETAALTSGGLMLSGSGIERVDAATLRQRLGR